MVGCQSNDVKRSQSQGVYIHDFFQFGTCLGKMPLGLMSFYCGQRS